MEHKNASAEMPQAVARVRIGGSRASRLSRIMRHWQLYLLLLLPLAFLIIFKYAPMFGLQIAFRDYNPGAGMAESPWVGMKHFNNFFNSREFKRLLSNTLILGLYALLAGIPLPIMLALGINTSRSRRFGKTAQLVTYAPYFVSVVIVVTMVTQFLAMRGGMFNNIRAMFGLKAINLMADPGAFRHIYVISEIWQKTGYNAVIYIAALASVSPELYEAATIDGASLFQRVLRIDLPSLIPTAMILLIINVGGVINVAYDKVLLLQTPMNMETADVINTYVYRMGIGSGQYSYASAIGFFNSVIAIILLLSTDLLARKVSEVSLFN